MCLDIVNTKNIEEVEFPSKRLRYALSFLFFLVLVAYNFALIDKI